MNNFTPRAQQVLALARKEADRFHHNYVGTEHILLGLIKLGQGVAVSVLQKMGLDLETAKAVRSVWQKMNDQFGPESDFTRIVEMVEKPRLIRIPRGEGQPVPSFSRHVLTSRKARKAFFDARRGDPHAAILARRR